MKEERRVEGLIHRQNVRDSRAKEEHIVYGLGNTSLLLRINRDPVTKTLDWRYVLHLIDHERRRWSSNNVLCFFLLHFFPFRQLQERHLGGQKLIIDFSFDNFMTKKFCHYTASHFKHFFGHNRQNFHPFDVHICNWDDQSLTAKHAVNLIPSLLDEDSPVDVHRKCYSEVFPRDQLLYLTPYSPHVLTEYNPNDIYVIGAVVDYGYDGPITLSKAKKLGIRTAYPPISRYMDWGIRAKNLPINIVGEIMLDFKNTQDWTISLEHVPQRLRKQPRQERHMLHKIINEVTDPRGELPRMSWDTVRDETRAIDDATAKGMSNPFKRPVERTSDGGDDDGVAAKVPSKQMNPFA